MAMTLGEIAVRYGLDLAGDPSQVVEGVAALAARRRPGTLTFCTGAKYRKQLAATRATAVVLPRELAAECPVAALISARPYASYARIAAGLHPPAAVTAGRAPGAQVAPTARVAASAWIGPNAVIGAGAVIGERCSIGPNCVIEAGRTPRRRLPPCSRVSRCAMTSSSAAAARSRRVRSSAAMASASRPTRTATSKVPHLGGARLGDDVDVGANTTIDRGTIEDTVIGDGVKLDNQVQVGHNCRIGAHTVIAGCVGISGSTVIGSRCMIGGGVGIVGHLEIGDEVIVTGASMVTRSLPGPGIYSSGMPAIEAATWRRTVARLHQLEGRRRGRGSTDSGGEGDDP